MPQWALSEELCLETVLLQAGRLMAAGRAGALVRLYRPALNAYAAIRLRRGDPPTEIVLRAHALYRESVRSTKRPTPFLTVQRIGTFICLEVWRCHSAESGGEPDG